MTVEVISLRIYRVNHYIKSFVVKRSQLVARSMHDVCKYSCICKKEKYTMIYFILRWDNFSVVSNPKRFSYSAKHVKKVYLLIMIISPCRRFFSEYYPFYTICIFILYYQYFKMSNDIFTNRVYRNLFEWNLVKRGNNGYIWVHIERVLWNM